MFFWVTRVLVFSCLFLTGCSTGESKDVEIATRNVSVVVGFIQVEPSGPYFRMHQTEAYVQYFDVVHSQTEKRTRIHLEPEAQRFVTKLLPGHYELLRIQIGEGPFRSESHVNMSFDVLADKTMYLGMWRLGIDPPKTVRMLQWEVLAKTPNLDPLQVFHGVFDEKPLEFSLLQPTTNHVRLFAVAPSQPRAKYFYRR